MKKVLTILFSASCVCPSLAQLRGTMQPAAVSFYNKAMAGVRPSIRSFVSTTARQLGGRNISEDSLRTTLKNTPQMAGLSNMDIDAVILLMMRQAANDKDLRDRLSSMKTANEKKQHQRAPVNKRDSLKRALNHSKDQQGRDIKDNLADMSQQDQMMLQQMMDQKSKLEEMISNLLKKIKDAEDEILANLK